jgi:CRP-like cAMP-binding protein
MIYSLGDTQMRPDAHALIARAIQTTQQLNEQLENAIRALPTSRKTVPAGRAIIGEGERPTGCCLVLEGFAARTKSTTNGNRQILSFHIPGDLPDLQSLYVQRMDHALIALTDVAIATIPHAAVRALSLAEPVFSDALWRAALFDLAIFREKIVGLGQRTAFQRIAHLYCEMFTRLSDAGLVRDADAFVFPVTQQDIGDALGLSTVHVNRSLQSLRQAKLIETQSKGRVRILNWAGLQRAGDFDPSYLRLEPSAS